MSDPAHWFVDNVIHALYVLGAAEGKITTDYCKVGGITTKVDAYWACKCMLLVNLADDCAVCVSLSLSFTSPAAYLKKNNPVLPELELPLSRPSGTVYVFPPSFSHLLQFHVDLGAEWALATALG